MKLRLTLVLLIGFAFGSGLVALPASADEHESVDIEETAEELIANQQAITDKQSEITELNEQIKALEGRQATAENEEDIIANKLAAIKGQLAQARLELRQTQLNIQQVRDDKDRTVADIDSLRIDMSVRREELAHVLRQLYIHEQVSLLDLFLRTGSRSDVLAERAILNELQDRSVGVVKQLHVEEEKLLAEEEALVEQETDLGQLQQLLVSQRADLADQEGDQQEFLAVNKDRQLRYERKIAEAQVARREIEQGLFQLQGAGVKLSLTQATDMAQLAGKFTGVRPALLLGVLKVESNIGGNLGSGVFPDDMQPQSREAFLRITKELGLDPNTAPISAAPSYGWGGAMGPAQIMPATWEAISARVGSYLGKSLPDPYELLDAFVGTSILLGDHGAFDPAREREAAGRYLAGPNWQKYPWYIDRVMAVAAEYQKQF